VHCGNQNKMDKTKTHTVTVPVVKMKHLIDVT